MKAISERVIVWILAFGVALFLKEGLTAFVSDYTVGFYTGAVIGIASAWVVFHFTPRIKGE